MDASMKNARKILVIKPSSLGDVIHSLPFLNVLKKSYPDARIHWVIARGLQEILEGHPMIDKLYIIDKDKWKDVRRLGHTIREMSALRASLRAEHYDVAVDLQGLLRSALITSASNAKIKAGFEEAREGAGLFYTHKIRGRSGLHAVDRYLKMAEFLGCDIPEVSFPLKATDVELPFPRYAVLAPGARWDSKRWEPEKFGELASMLPIDSIIIGGKSDIDSASVVIDKSKGKAVSLAGKTSLKELTGIIKGAEFVICNDSGPMHMAAALGVTVFAIFGPTSHILTGPYGDIHKIIRADVQCAPCFKRKCKRPICMEKVSVKDVYREVMNKFPA